MENSLISRCFPVNACRTWPYHQYYLGKEDQQGRKNGHGENHWSGAESLEWYSGQFVRDMMHGEGEYRWRYQGPEGVFITYEGQFYGNRMHGYGVLSYPDGTVFNGIFYHNMRWGPGVESYTNQRENIGLWRGKQIVRLTWRPDTPSIALDLSQDSTSKTYAETYRSLLTTRIHIVGEVNSAVELLKQSGSDPITASEKWTKLYPKYCTDLASQLCHNEIFDYEYYKNKIVELEEVDTVPNQDENFDKDDRPSLETYYAWNNSDMIVSMMKHCFKHEMQRSRSGIDLKTLLTGPRNLYRRAAKHEIYCRTLILASYLGHIKNVAQLVNEENVHPDVADIQGNTALMYATCGNQVDIVHFLVEAGANVNSFNDSCCTPLGMALIKYACGSKDVATSGMIQALLPPSPAVAPPASTSLEEKPSEWHITRDLHIQSDQLATAASLKTKDKRRTIAGDELRGRKKTVGVEETTLLRERKNNNSFTSHKDIEKSNDKPSDLTEEEQLFENMNKEFEIKVIDLLASPGAASPVPYFFDVSDMVKEVDANINEQNHPPEGKAKLLIPSKNTKDIIRTSRDVTRLGSEKHIAREPSADQVKTEMLNQNMSTILQLLSDGADPFQVRCPQPALRIALASGSADLVRHLVKHGADINEVYPETSNYTILDVAVSQPLSYENLVLIRTILECGGKTDHRLKYPNNSELTSPEVPGPTLLHVVLAKRTDDGTQQIRNQLLELLLEYNCEALAQFKGCSAVDVCMMKDMNLFDIFIKCPKVDLNAVINERNQSILVKMFSSQSCKNVPITDRLQTLTTLLLYGADPLSECQDGIKKYANIFMYAKQVLAMGISSFGLSKLSGHQTGGGIEVKSRKSIVKNIKETNDKQTKTVSKSGNDDTKDYKQALDLVKDCARILHVRWIQAKLLKELIQVVIKYEHRQWNMILPEHKNKKACGFWLSCPRSLEIWEILKIDRKKKFNWRRILKHVLCIVQFDVNRTKTTFKWPLTSEEKDMIENEVYCILHEHRLTAKMAVNLAEKPLQLARPYVTPELAVDAEKFQVCFECAIPFEDQAKILCVYCKQVSYCSFDCMKMNIEVNAGSHPCSEYLKTKYYPTPSETVTLSI